MVLKTYQIISLAACLANGLFAQVDRSPHAVRFVDVDNNVKLEVLDWGGSGRPLVLLAGLGSTAHVFDTLAIRLSKGGRR